MYIILYTEYNGENVFIEYNALYEIRSIAIAAKHTLAIFSTIYYYIQYNSFKGKDPR